MAIHKSFKQFTETATVHGLYKIGHSSSTLKRAAWTIVVVGLFGALVYQLTLLLIDHFSYKTYTEIDKITATTMQFPSVTICHTNNFKLSEFKKIVPNIKELVEKTRNKSILFNSIIPIRSSDVARYEKVFKSNSTLNKQLSSTPGALQWKFMDWCTWTSVIECKYPDDFADFFYVSSMGFCTTFNPKGKYTQISAGHAFGLELKLFVDQSDKVPTLVEGSGGVTVMVHPKEIYPNPMSEAMLIPTGFQTRIALKKTVHHRQKSPYSSNCTDGKGIFQIHPGNYTVKNCQYTCFMKAALEICGDREAAYQYHKPIQYAESLKRFKSKNVSDISIGACFRQIYDKYLQNKLKCDCPPSCIEHRIHRTASSAQWPQLADMEYYRPLIAKFTNKTTVSNQDVYNSLVSLQIYYEELGHDEIREQVASPLSKLASNIGGQFGLWLGASFFSVTEVIVYLFTSVVRVYQHKIRPAKEFETNTHVQQLNYMNNDY